MPRGFCLRALDPLAVDSGYCPLSVCSAGSQERGSGSPHPCLLLQPRLRCWGRLGWGPSQWVCPSCCSGWSPMVYLGLWNIPTPPPEERFLVWFGFLIPFHQQQSPLTVCQDREYLLTSPGWFKVFVSQQSEGRRVGAGRAPCFTIVAVIPHPRPAPLRELLLHSPLPSQISPVGIPWASLENPLRPAAPAVFLSQIRSHAAFNNPSTF